MRRRDLLKLGVGAVGLSILPGCGKRSRTVPRGIILLVSDGMSQSVPALAQQFSLQVRGEGTCWQRWLADERVVRGEADMSALNTPVTDSAAAASAWGSGVRVITRMLNTLADGRELKTLCELVKDSGRRCGLVSSARMTHATPAGFAANAFLRNYEDDIAPQYLGRVDVLHGGGSSHFDAEDRKDGRDVLGEYAAAGYEVVRDRGACREVRGKKVLGLYSRDHLPYVIDRSDSEFVQRRVPTLAEMTQAALRSLDGPEGFFLMVEGARIDHAAHMNDAPGLLWEQLDFDDALAVADDFARRNGDVLVIATTDHGNSSPALNGVGHGYDRSGDCFARLAAAAVSHEALQSRLGGRLAMLSGAEKLRVCGETVVEGSGIVITEKEAKALALAVDKGWPEDWNHQQRNFAGVLGQVLGNHTGIGWTGVTHTSEPAPLLARGPGAEGFRGPQHNTDLYHRVCGLWGIRHKNPSMDIEAAHRVLPRPIQGPHPWDIGA